MCSRSQFLGFSRRIFSAGRSYRVCPGETLVTGGAIGPGSVNPAEPVLGGLDRTEHKPELDFTFYQVKEFNKPLHQQWSAEPSILKKTQQNDDNIFQGKIFTGY